MRHTSGPGGRPIDADVLRALAEVPRRFAATAHDLAETAGMPVPSVATKLQALVKAGLARRHWGPDDAPGRSYSITDEGHDHLMRLEREQSAANAPVKAARDFSRR